MGSNTSPLTQTWVETPCIRSAALSRAAGCNIYLKLETLQPSGSFKSRGVGHMMSTAILHHGPSKPIHFYTSSGGNAGLACITAANVLKRPATVVVPLSTSALMIQKLKLLGADVVQIGKHWSEADTYLRDELLAKDADGIYVHPFDHKDIWEGHSSMIDEIEVQMRYQGGYDAVVCSVGGGGLFCGIMQGLERNGHLGQNESSRKSTGGVRVLAMETIGADSLNVSVKQGELTRLPAITSIATSLGATQVAEQAFRWSQRPEVVSHTLTDAEAAMACVQFADDERIIVETACGAAVATAYIGTLHSVLFPELSKEEFAGKTVVLIVCGGSNITLQILEKYKEQYGGEKP
ncbi:tryptophan synthase beta subunit-like PLP-dependent enzyme [Mollisia scopiformis]|uniref:L-serine ammonia-lyase n=1 Tax=Mollisia scopiformis TaxID=149040 RepID=A0A194X631_MOLSC|nr:tryptophan synthase beta subunit-like PLP-dependent enzyme [Mollisia scopiformis]KUJ15519.1 tryptophan synthase beta subunit-like PLP-dependent enzyme [Mollisia scopiformis]